MSTTTAVPQLRAPLERIDPGPNARPLDDEHVKSLAASIALRGLIVPLLVAPAGERYTLIAGHHRYAACKSLGLADVEVTVRDQDRTSADSAAENVVRKALTPLEEARAVKSMLDEGYTLDGAATVLGWSRQLVGARAKILELPEVAQQLLGDGVLAVGSVATLTSISSVSVPLCELAANAVAEGTIDGEQLAHNPGWAIGHAVRESNSSVFACYLSTLGAREIEELRLGKRAQVSYKKAEELHRKLDRYAYGPPTIRFTDADVDQARAAGVLIEFDQSTPIITDRTLLRELAKQAIERTVTELCARIEAKTAERRETAGSQKPAPSPKDALDAEHRAAMRELTGRAHGTNLDLGAALINKLATVKPDDMDVARFFVYGLLGPEAAAYSSHGERARVLAANGIRLVVEEHRKATAPTLKSGKPGKTRTDYGEPEDALRWLWRFIDGARTAGELYGRALVVFAAQAYASDLVLPQSQRHPAALPSSQKDAARKAFERVTHALLPASHLELRRALEREGRRYAKRCQALARATEETVDGESRETTSSQ